MALTINHQTNDISATSGSMTIDGSAVGGGGADLYAANESSPTAQPSATGANAIAIGDSAAASGPDAFAIGQDTTASGNFATALGSNGDGTGATASGNGSLAIHGSTASGSNSIAIGDSSVSSAVASIAIGGDTDATANYNIALGRGAQALTNASAVAIGKSRASGSNSLALNTDNNTSSYGAGGTDSIAIGKLAKTGSNTSAIAIGENALITGTGYRSIAIGNYAEAGPLFDAVALGSNTKASGNNSFALGYHSVSTPYGKYAYASGKFNDSGDAQGGQYILRADVTDTTVTTLTTDNSTAAATNQIVAAADTAIAFDGLVTVLQNGAQGWSAFKIQGLLVNDGGGPTYVAGSSVTAITNNSNFTLALSADNTNKALSIKFTGYSNYTIRVVANVRTSEVTYA